jgi:hypothetical protein
MSDINYVCARWRDAVTDPPPDGWQGLIKDKNGTTYRAIRTTWPGMPIVWELLLFEGEDHDITPGDQWLDVTTIPAIPRAAVQAAVDEMKRRYQHGENCINGEDGSCEGCNLYRFQFPHCKSFACIERFTGVTPSEVQ